MIGSGVFVDHPPVPIVGITFMLNLDMVGRLGDRPLIVDAAHATAAARALVDSLFTALALPFRIEAETSDRSDHASFGRVRVPAISLFTGYHPDYHTPGDTPQRIDIAGLERVIAVAELLVRAVADRPGRFGSSP